MTNLCPFCFQDMDERPRVKSRTGRYCGWCGKDKPAAPRIQPPEDVHCADDYEEATT